jgi:hypothetical protein
MGGCFIVHRPPSTDHFQLSRIDQIYYGAAGLFALLAPPFPKESCFNLDVSSVFVLLESLNRAVQDKLDSSIFDVVVINNIDTLAYQWEIVKCVIT